MLRRLSRGRAALVLAFQLAAAALVGCSGEKYDVVIYTSMDQEHSEAILQRFEERSGLKVRMEFDIEANKTVGFVQRIRQEAGAPRGDVFWNNELANTIALANEGLLERYDSPSAADIPAEYRDPAHHWTGFALRARCLILNTTKMAELGGSPSDWPDSLDDLVSGPYAKHGSVARPLDGTTLTHFAVLYQQRGFEAGHAFAQQLFELNAKGDLSLTAGNGPLMRSVGEGALAWGFTDTDDFNVGRLRGYPVERRFADQGEGGVGTLVIPNSVAILKGAPNLANAKLLVDFLLSKEVEELLARADSAQIPTRADVPRPEHVPSLADLKIMAVDWAAVGAALPAVHEDLKRVFLR
jgi:iron(III) transport system substrate-binding protein